MISSRVAIFIGPLFLLLAAPVSGAQATESKPTGRQAADLDGAWEIAMDKGAKTCRVLLRAQQSDNGAYFLGMPPACRHSMPDLVKVGRWTLPDDAHLTLNEPAGAAVLSLAAVGDAFVGAQGGHAYELRRLPDSGRSAASLKPSADESAGNRLEITKVAKRTRTATAEVSETKGDLTGRYAVMREKRDTGCMLTLDEAKAKGGDRAHLAPGCRDQGIVIFDPAAWQIVKGELVLTARAGHKTHLLKSGEGAWAKDPKDGGKPLGLKKL